MRSGRSGHGIKRSRPRQQNEATARLLDTQVALSQQRIILLLGEPRHRHSDTGGDAGERRLDWKPYGQVIGHALTDAVAVPHTTQPLALIRAYNQSINQLISRSVNGILRGTQRFSFSFSFSLLIPCSSYIMTE